MDARPASKRPATARYLEMTLGSWGESLWLASAKERNYFQSKSVAKIGREKAD